MHQTNMESLSVPNICANCGKGEEESNNLKSCAACKLVKYCSRECQSAHRPQHKQACKKQAAEIYDEKLFKDVEREECPICMAPLPFENNSSCFKACCGKIICMGCIYAMAISEMDRGKKQFDDQICPFCRETNATSEKEENKLLKKLMDNGNGGAFNQLAGYYDQGINGLLQDYQKANEFFLKAGELGHSAAYFSLAQNYVFGYGVEVDTKKARHYFELAAMSGHVQARQNLGCEEWEKGNKHRAMKHWSIAARAGHEDTLKGVKRGYLTGLVTKDEYANTLRAYHERQKEMKSELREKVAVLGKIM